MDRGKCVCGREKLWWPNGRDGVEDQEKTFHGTERLMNFRAERSRKVGDVGVMWVLTVFLL